MNKKKLAVELSKLKSVEKPKVKLEQYSLGSEISAEILWFAYLNNDIKGKVIADLGCGNGILGIGALLLGAKKVYFVDVDEESIRICKENLRNFKDFYLFNSKVEDFDKKVDVVIENPPFGVKEKHADKVFLEKAMKVSKVIYSFHKLESKEFIEKLIKGKFKVDKLMRFELKLRKSMDFHRKKEHKVEIGCWRLVK